MFLRPEDNYPLCPDDAPAEATAAVGSPSEELSLEPDPDVPLQPAAAASPGRTRDAPVTQRRDEITPDHDLERLEASLRWLQRQEAATRLPRATPLARVPGLPPAEAHGGDAFREPLSLEPERMAPPPDSFRASRLGLFGVVTGSIVAAALGYYAAQGWAPRSAEPVSRSQLASVNPQVAPAPLLTGSPRESWPVKAADDDPETSARNQGRSQPPMAAPAAEVAEQKMAMLQPPNDATAQAAPKSKPIRTLDPDQIQLLMKQGEQFAASGDLVTARLVFQRAAEAGEATAAIALGATYDPTVLAKLGVVGLATDVEMARSWYRKAESLGSSEATRRLAIIANR